MERREAIGTGSAGLAIALLKPAHVPADQHSVMKPSTEGFYEAREEARLAHYGGENKRAHYFYHQAIKLAPEDIESEALAEVIEGMNCVKGCLAEDEQALPRLQAAVEEDTEKLRAAVSLRSLALEARV